MADPVRVVFRNQARRPVTVVISGVTAGGPIQLASGVVSEASGLFRVDGGYTSYTCLAYAEEMVTPPMNESSKVSVVFTIDAGEQA